jgi:hypothetical protein
MNSTPVIIHNISGAAVIADVRVPKGTRHISIIPVAPEVLANCALLSPEEDEILDEEIVEEPQSSYEQVLLLTARVRPDELLFPEFLARVDALGMGTRIDVSHLLAMYRGARAGWSPDMIAMGIEARASAPPRPPLETTIKAAAGRSYEFCDFLDRVDWIGMGRSIDVHTLLRLWTAR